MRAGPISVCGDVQRKSASVCSGQNAVCVCVCVTVCECECVCVCVCVVCVCGVYVCEHVCGRGVKGVHYEISCMNCCKLIAVV